MVEVLSEEVKEGMCTQALLAGTSGVVVVAWTEYGGGVRVGW